MPRRILTIPFEPQIATAVTIFLIVAILAGYISVLKRNGWIGKTSVESGLKGNVLQNLPELKIQSSNIKAKETKVVNKMENEKTKRNETSSTVEPKETNTPQIENPKVPDTSTKDNSEGCSHYFGYLATLPKGANTPDTCYVCTDLINCYKKN